MNDPALIIAGCLLLPILAAAAAQGLIQLGRHHDRNKAAVQRFYTRMRSRRPANQRNHELLLTALANHTHDETGRAVFRNPT